MTKMKGVLSMSGCGWNTLWTDQSRQRESKPRTVGINSLIDKGLGYHAFQDLLGTAADHIDFIKLGFGTAVITPYWLLKAKIELARQNQINLFPGGTFFEVTYRQGDALAYFQTLLSFGFEWVEISDGTIDLTLKERGQAIIQARQLGLNVITEIGKKAEHKAPPIEEFLMIYQHDLEHGAAYVTMEGRDHGRQVGIYDEHGQVQTHYVLELLKQIDPAKIIWEAPQKKQQTALLELIRSKANLGNIPANEVLAVETLRRGLRSDTFFLWEQQK
jgi:phosphosulfolactate synthase